MKKSSQCLLAFVVVLGSLVPEVRADVTLPKVLSSHMVLQRERPLPIWGWADPGEEVTVKLDAATAATKADSKGDWKVTLPAVKADGKAHTMAISGKNKIDLDDILIGEVWIGSGQSNMEFNVAGSLGRKEAFAVANCPQIRLLHVGKVQAPQPAKDIVVAGGVSGTKGQPASAAPTGPAWKVCSPQTMPLFSAVLYCFGQRLHKDLDLPIGLINSSWGATRIEAWTASGANSGGIYNGMIAPLEPLAIRGAIWYQGESNVNMKTGPTYADKMKSLIGGWRQAWGQDLSFYFVQIAPWAGTKEVASPTQARLGWKYEPGRLPALWEYQAASLKIPGTGMAVITDLVDDINNIHPKNKFDVGNRLALWRWRKTMAGRISYTRDRSTSPLRSRAARSGSASPTSAAG